MKVPEERQVHDLISSIEERTSLNLYLSSTPVPVHTRPGDILAYYVFYQEKAFRLEYLSGTLSGISLFDTPTDLLNPDLRVDLSDLDDTGSSQIISNLLLALPSAEDDTEGLKEVQEFVTHMGDFILTKGASYAFESYEIWADSRDKTPLTKIQFADSFNKLANQQSKELTERIEAPFHGETLVVSPEESSAFLSQVIQSEELYSIKMLESALKSMAQDEDVNAMFVCGEQVQPIKSKVKEIFQEEDVWTSKVMWKDRVTSIYQFISLLWKYRSDHILVFDNVDAPLKRKDHNFNSMLDEIMKTESPNRIVSYTRKERKP